jgi:hypothetical protein
LSEQLFLRQHTLQVLLFFINKKKKPNITQIDFRLSGQRTSILFQRSQVQIPERANFLQFKHI